MFGDQWTCPCGWANIFLRKRCRECGKEKPVDAEIMPAAEVMARVHARSNPEPPNP